MAFLDIKMMVVDDVTFKHTIYRNSTHTNRYIYATSDLSHDTLKTLLLANHAFHI